MESTCPDEEEEIELENSTTVASKEDLLAVTHDGPTSPVLQGPFGSQHLTVNKVGLHCLGRNLTKCPIGHPCMLELPVDAVMHAVEQLLAKNKLVL